MTGHQLVSPAHLSRPSSLLHAFRTALLKATNSCGCVCCRPHPLALKEPPAPSMETQSRHWLPQPKARSHHCCALSSVLYICSVHLSAHHYRISLLYFLFSSLSVPTALSLSTPSPVCCTCAGWSCRAEAEGVFVVTREGREPTANTWPTFHEDMWRFRDWSPPPALLHLFLASPGMLNVDWWMFPNSAFPTLSAITTSRYTFLTL